MSREKRYTPGPWFMATSNSYRRIVSHHGNVCEPTKQRDGHPDLHFPNGGFMGPDAHVLTAAPELLEELEDRLDSDRCGCGHPACKPCMRDAETERVIAKAYGEETT